MKFTKCNEEQFFKIFPPEDRKTIIMGGDGSVETIKHDRFVCCDSCNTRIYEDPNEVAYLILEVEGYRSTRLECKDCFVKWCKITKQYDPEIKELSVDEAIDYLKSDAGYPYDEDDELCEDEEF